MNGARRSFLTLAEVVAFAAVQLAAGGTGMVLAYLRLQPASPDPFTAVPASWALWQHLHVLVVPFLTFFLGVLWVRHVLPSWCARRPRRRTGVSLAALAAVMVLSGYALQVSVEEGWRQLLRWLHLVAGVLWLITSLLHLLGPRVPQGWQTANGRTGVCPPAPAPLTPPRRGAPGTDRPPSAHPTSPHLE